MPRRYGYVILTYIVMQFSAYLFTPLLFLLLPISKFEAAIYWSLFSFIAGLVVVLLLMKPDMKDMPDRAAADGPSIIVWSIVGVFMAYAAQFLAVFIETELLGITPGSENTAMIMEITRMAPVFIIIPAIIAPILEEIIFRKVIFGTLYKKTNFFIAAVISAFVFGIIHGEPIHILIYASMGFVFAFLYVKTKRIIVPIIVHMCLNTISVSLQLLFDPEDLERMIQEQQEVLMMILGVGII
ncbi:lysostaphin resistance A-like protein [Virgibacillus sp. W0181]|uniref:CPBP family intramembrane glutamic endopeptidase n=1 Tax=Virgibacillus sp. W0181 TaxID=3391581 RepID=UPI003F4791A7